MIVILRYHCPSKKNEFSRRSSENFSAEIRNNSNSINTCWMDVSLWISYPSNIKI